jgi:hypothetical protein
MKMRVLWSNVVLVALLGACSKSSSDANLKPGEIAIDGSNRARLASRTCAAMATYSPHTMKQD